MGGVIDYSMSPSGKFLAVGGLAGFQIFHFNGANPITKYAGLLTGNPIDQIFWEREPCVRDQPEGRKAVRMDRDLDRGDAGSGVAAPDSKRAELDCSA